jgi:hypothetical protein
MFIANFGTDHRHALSIHLLPEIAIECHKLLSAAPCLLRFDGSISNASVIIGNGEGGGCGYKNQDISTSARPVTLSETGDIFSAFQNANCSLAAAKGATCTYGCLYACFNQSLQSLILRGPPPRTAHTNEEMPCDILLGRCTTLTSPIRRLQAPNGTTIATFGDSKPYTFCEVDPSTEEIVGGIVIKPATNPFVYQPLTISCQ